MTEGTADILATARRLADDVLFPDAIRVDSLDAVMDKLAATWTQAVL